MFGQMKMFGNSRYQMASYSPVPSGQGVSRSYPDSVTAMVCSHCAESERSLVTTVQPSESTLVAAFPALIIVDSKNHTGFKQHARLGYTIVQNLWCRMIFLTHTVATIFSHYRKSCALSQLLNACTDVAERRTRRTALMPATMD